MAERFELARTVMRRRTGLDTNQAWRRLLKEHQNIAALKLATEDDIAIRIDAVDLEPSQTSNARCAKSIPSLSHSAPI